LARPTGLSGPNGRFSHRFSDGNDASSLLKNLEMESFLVLADRCWGGAVELDVIF
jgi:hypothetical protein